MDYNAEQAERILRIASTFLAGPETPQNKLSKIWSMLLVSRSIALANGLRQRIGDQVHGGPFKGLTLPNGMVTNSHAPMLLGCYEHELHPVIDKVITKNYSHIVNIGCSMGYYAVGFARRLPHVKVEAFDIDASARAACAQLVQLNKVEDRVHIKGEFRGEDFAAYPPGKTLILMDIEGGENALLNPDLYPALHHMDVIVELHDVLEKDLSKTISQRFTPTHDIEIIKNHAALPSLEGIVPDDFYFDAFDQLILGWEGRHGLTPWGIYTARA